MKRIKCHLILHSKVKHLNQIFAGFVELNKKGIVELSKENKYDTGKQILEVIINDNIKVIFDTMDEQEFYAKTVMKIDNIDYYFKRSFKSIEASKYNFKSYPLGLNYNVYSKNGNILDLKEVIKNKLIKIIKNYKYNFYPEDFESFSISEDKPKICFLTRVWDTNSKEIENEDVRKEREEINNFRVECIKACKENFKENFIGGIEDSEFARKYFSEFITKNTDITKRDKFLNILKETEICISTTGLHKSIGWKLGEYVAASRVIVSEPLYYELPGEFKNGKNYIEFRNADELIEVLTYLINNKEKRQEIMKNNLYYYNNYVKPEMIVLNALLKVIN
ncbi:MULTISPECIES: glycosyltransferase [unclassified Clostridium]|uniref:glycosyltransferase n=1 Tax=unclassified Clostridium TaxID=2614128 RepID=UPI0002977F18|nr:MULTISPECIES: glycosyltransferase [unclassified Clostridium]EKQ56942.1 MAG: hypothetical protein A370_01438 [Clostridium sp. Maddingley MBC34-26]